MANGLKERYIEDNKQKIKSLKSITKDYERKSNMFNYVDEDDVDILFIAAIIPDKVFRDYDIMPVVERLLRGLGKSMMDDDPNEFEECKKQLLEEFEKRERTE